MHFPYQIEHLGSTAVANLGGKGIIDIYILIDPSLLSQAKESIIESDYEARPAEGNNYRFVFVRVDWANLPTPQRYHLHLCTNNSDEFEKNVRFCNYLQNHPDAVREYAQVKREACKVASQSKEAYLSIKNPFIQKILHLAQREARE